MATTFQELYSRLKGDLQGIPLNRAMQAVQDAWRDLCESRLWSFNFGECDLLAPNATTVGTVTVTQYSTQVVGDTTAAVAWAAIPVQTLITSQQFRSGPTGEIFSIVAYNGTNTVTIDRPWPYATAAGAGYQIYRCYYSVSDASPAATQPFLCWESVFDPVNIYAFRNIALTKGDLDVFDPQRASFQNPVYLAAYKPDSQGNMMYEMWPHPTNANPYQTLYRTSGADLVNDTDTLPPTVSRRLVSLRAMLFALDWAQVNQGQIQGGARVNWGQLRAQTTQQYEQELARYGAEDDERMLSYFVRHRAYQGPGILTGQWLQAHDGFGTFFGF